MPGTIKLKTIQHQLIHTWCHYINQSVEDHVFDDQPLEYHAVDDLKPFLNQTINIMKTNHNRLIKTALSLIGLDIITRTTYRQLGQIWINNNDFGGINPHIQVDFTQFLQTLRHQLTMLNQNLHVKINAQIFTTIEHLIDFYQKQPMTWFNMQKDDMDDNGMLDGSYNTESLWEAYYPYVSRSYPNYKNDNPEASAWNLIVYQLKQTMKNEIINYPNPTYFKLSQTVY